ncbi:MAG: hypothetical protein SFV54_18655 [Bryobacteraceae bacterium]|nr:hypothetical protein [Bryobacteraceae bacterium]
MKRALPLLALALFGDGAPPSRYKNPIELAVSADGKLLYVVCEGSDELAVINLATAAPPRRIAVGRHPKGIVLSNNSAYVANSWSDTVTEVSTATLEVTRTLRTGFEPTSVALAGNSLYTANRIGNDISVIDLSTGEETRRLSAGRGASYLSLSPDGQLYSTHIYPNPAAFRTSPASEITVVDPGEHRVTRRIPLPAAAGVFHVAFAAKTNIGIAAQLRPKNLIPLAHVAHGWTVGNSLAVLGDDVGAEPVQLPLDDIERHLALPFGVAISPNNRAAYVSFSGSDTVAEIDLDRLTHLIRETPSAERKRLANDLSVSAHYISARIRVGRNPKGIALSPDGKRLYVANRLDDTVSVIDTAARKVVRTLSLGGPVTDTPERRGARLFHTARYSFQGQFACASCHLEETFDGLSWDLEPDGFAIDIVDNRLLEDVGPTAPFKWNAGNPDLETECGPRTAMFFFRSQGFSKTELADLVRFVKSIPVRPNRYRLKGGELTAAQERGKAIFERTRRKDGSPIDEMLQCPVCHSGRYYTNNQVFDVGTGKRSDRSPLVDVPQLTNIALTAPYLHDGSALTLEEIWTVFNPRDQHGVTNDLAKDELNDLIEYLKTL